MANLSYAQAGLTLKPGNTPSPLVKDLQRDLRSLGYLRNTIDGVFGTGTSRAVRALQFDLLANTGGSRSGDGSAPVAIKDYNKGRVSASTGEVDQNLTGCIADMLADPLFPKLPFSSSPASDNQKALQAIAGLCKDQVPFPFLFGILVQESGAKHYYEPKAPDADSFVVIGMDTNDAANKDVITSRGYGIGQYTLFHHPPTPQEMSSFISDPVKNVAAGIQELQDKFKNYVVGKSSGGSADDRIHDFGAGPLRLCKFPGGDPRYLRDCVKCMKDAGMQNIVASVTPVYEGASQQFEKTQYHVGSYNGVPMRSKIPCDWSYAVRRYNGSGPNSYDYQAEVLLRVPNDPRAASPADGS